ncbi:MAG: hypothetical protein WEG36_08270 [Gemmatimonadota bacterium]|jgi:hypothetical protein
MFLSLLLATLLISLAVSLAVGATFRVPIGRILERLVGVELAPAWRRYVFFAVVIVGVSGGVRIYQMERYLSTEAPGGTQLVLDRDRWVLEVYGTIMGSLQSMAWMLLVFFLVSLVAYVLVRGFEMRRERKADG